MSEPQPHVISPRGNAEQSRERSGILKLLFGAAAGQALAVLLSPVLTRLFEPQHFGAYAAYSSLLGLFLVVTSLRYEITIPQAKDDQDAFHLVALSALITCGMSVLAWLLTTPLVNIWIDIQNRAAASGDKQLAISDLSAHFPTILALAVLVAGLSRILNFWGVRRQEYAVIAQMKASQGIGAVALQLIFGAAGFLKSGLLAGDALGRALGCTRLGASLLRDTRAGQWRLQFARITALAGEHKRYALLSAPAAVINSAGLLAAPLLITALYGLQAGGLFALAQRIAGMPVSLLSQAFADVYVGSLTKARRTAGGSLVGLHRRFARKLALLAAAALIAMWCVPQSLIEMVFGSEWGNAASYLRALSFLAFGQLMVAPLSQTLLILDFHRWQISWDVLRFAIGTGSLVAAYKLGAPPAAAVAAYALANLVMYGLLYLMTVSALRRSEAAATS